MFEKNFYCVSSRIESSGQLYGCFKIGPFSRHQSLTFANALRRTLLADKSRCTFHAVQINDVEHEFSSLIGVRESVVDILLNLEKLIFQIKKPITKPQVAFINFCGPGILRAQHIYLPSNLQCVIPSQYIATLEVDGKLTLKLFFSPDWNKFQFFLQNLILEKKDTHFGTGAEGTFGGHSIKGSMWKDRRQELPKKINQQKYLKKNIEKQNSILRKISPSSHSDTPHAFSITQILKNRLKIVHYLKNTFRSSYLQLLSIQFQYLHRKIPTSKIPWSFSLKKEKIESTYKKLVPRWRVQYQRRKTYYKKYKIRWNFLKNRGSRAWEAQPAISGKLKIQARESPFVERAASIGTSATQARWRGRGDIFEENFLFLNSSRCAIEKANYTLQSHFLEGSLRRSALGQPDPVSVGGPAQTKNNIFLSRTNISKNPAQTDRLPALPREAHDARRAIVFGTQFGSSLPRGFNQQNNLSQKMNNFTEKKSHFLASAKNRSFPFKYHLKLNSHSPIQRKLPSLGYDKSFRFMLNNNLNKISSIGSWLENRGIISKNEEFILFEVWTDGSVLPQTAILRAIHELLFEMFPYSLQISKYEKVNPISNNKIFSFMNRKNSFKFIQNSLKRQMLFSDLSKKSFREKFLNLEIGNFYFDLETYLFLKKRKIHRIIDFLKFLDQKEMTKLINTQKQNLKPGLKMTLYKFQIFLHSFIG